MSVHHSSLDSSDLEWIARSFGKARQSGYDQWIGQCPAHKDNSPSLSVSLGHKGQILFYCHAGCSYESILDTLRPDVQYLVKIKNSERLYREYYRNEKHNLKISKGRSDITRPDNLDKPDKNKENRNVLALKKMIKDAKPVISSPVEAYLNKRLKGRFAAVQGIMESGLIQYLPSHWHAESKQCWPVMVASILNGNDLIGLHRTYLDEEGDQAPVFPTKKIVGKLGGGCTPFGTVQSTLIVAEGIETALSLYAMFQTPVWAALSATNMTNINLPPLPLAETVYIAQDNDAAGRKNARKAADKFWREGRRVVIMNPSDSVINDFNDYLTTGESFEQYRHHFHGVQTLNGGN